MTSRERVFRTLEFKVPDRAPRQLWALPWVNMFAKDQMDMILQEFPSDFIAPGHVLASSERRSGQEGRKGTYVDDWGCIWVSGEDGIVGEVKHPPLADFSAMNNFSPPWEIVKRADWDEVNRAQEKNLAGEQKFMLCGTSIRPFERMQFLRGTESLYLDIGYGSAEFRRLLEIVHEFYLKELEAWAATDCDGISFMDDWGSQKSLLISPAMWRELFKPLYKDYCDIIHSSGKKVFMHSDGHIAAIYEDLIEIGVDAINSQLFCMNIEELGRQFSGRIAFWGEIDRQRILPFGTVEDVYKAVGRVRRSLEGDTGGMIAQCEWGPNNPPENIRAVFEAWLIPINELS